MNMRVDLMDLTEAPTSPSDDDGLGCLRTERGNLPLDTIDIRAALTGLASAIELTQGFRNPHSEPLEATFIFPLPPRAAVTALRMEADGRIVQGVLKEREAARADYDQAVAEGKRASIAEEERPGVFTMRVGNIMPGERVSVHVTLAGALAYEDGSATFRFPLVVAPRFIPGEPLPDGQVGDGVAQDTDAVPDASRISPPVLLPGFPNPVNLSVAVDIDPAGLPLAGVSTSLHSTATTADDSGGLRVRLEPGERADRDFLLRLTFTDDTAIRSSLAVRPDSSDSGTGGTFALTVLPPTASAKATPRDVVLVLDRSGSMKGWKMVAARRAAARIIDTLNTADRFAVLAFDNVVVTPPSLGEGLVEASDRNRFRAVEFLGTVDAYGGTQMLEPLTRAAALLGADSTQDRVLVLVTDGQVGNEDQVLQRLSPELQGVRVHTVGVDRAVNEAFLQRLAGAHGRCELVESEDRLDEVMQHIHRRIAAPVVTGLRLTSSGLAVDADSFAPFPVPDLFEGVPLVLTGRYTGEPSGTVTVTNDQGWEVSVEASRSDNQALSALWARSRIRDLEDRYVSGTGDQSHLEKRIVETSLGFGVLCRFTAFVAVDERVVNESGQVHRVTQPVDLPSGWEPQALFGSNFSASASAPMGRGVPLAFAPSPAAPAATTYVAESAHPRPTVGRRLPPRPTAADLAPDPLKGKARGRKPQQPDVHPPQAQPTPPAMPTSPPTLIDFAINERRALLADDKKDVWARAALLAALAERIFALLDHWKQTGEDELARTSLAALAKDLAKPTDNPNMADSLWFMAIATLNTFSKPRPNPRKNFWKR
ncbi:VIT domain-containing protein [Actinophytocola xanthii]|uniref:Trypsin n=1 Tax=Actinophytocola xanthii TaxID=1912961 RepID=A0A1Q8C7X6_9PSEU|nr:VIT domain-containing protein [Actinophytocola xanthii]OLF10423.1 trypsin [Actinophytocola xanthii]